MKTLLIVESETKAKSISKMLNDDYLVIHTGGHICDISNTFNLNEKKELTWELEYILLKAGKVFLNKVKKIAVSKDSNVDKVVLATDFDREGEVISFNIQELLKKELKTNISFNRIILREINKKSLEYSLNNTVDLSLTLVKSQESRRILDKMIGYSLSPLLNKFIKNNNSAGRVQTLSLCLLSERTKEHFSFVPKEIYSLKTTISDSSVEITFKGEKTFSSLEKVEELEKKSPTLFYLEKETEKTHNLPLIHPFKTTTLQKACNTFFSFSPSKTMYISQELFEGKKIKDEIKGLISYPRTDSTRVNREFFENTKKYLKTTYNVTEFSNLDSAGKKDLNVQDAHECIRPLDLNLTPDSIKEYLTKDEFSIYSIIYFSFLASCFPPIQVKRIKYLFKNKEYAFFLTNEAIHYKSFTIIPECERFFYIKKKYFSIQKEMQLVVKKNISFTKPKPLYTEISLISELEKNGIGRPSTYAGIVYKLEDRKYIEINEKKISTTEVGDIVSSQLKKAFSEIFSLEFTQKMEKELHEISLNNMKKDVFLNAFLSAFTEKFIHFKNTILENKERRVNKLCFFATANPCCFSENMDLT